MAGQVWGVAAEGGFLYSDNLSKALRHSVQPLVKFRQFAAVKDAAEGVTYKKGDTFRWDVFSDITTQGTTLPEGSTMPESGFTITQGSLTVTEYGNSVPYTGKLDDLSLLPVKTIINEVLKNDAKKAFDTAAHAQFNACRLRVAPTGGTSTTSITATDTGSTAVVNNIAMGTGHVKAIVDYMKERNIPPYMGDDYMALGWPTTFRSFKNELEGVYKYVQSGVTLIMNGEVGRYEGVRFVEQTNVPKGNAGVAWTNAKSDWAYFFGADTVAEGVIVPEEMRGKIPSDYGRSRGVAWYYLGGFGIVYGGANATMIKNSRIVKWDSAS
jgi:N4-gp56 family major capsid protein